MLSFVKVTLTSTYRTTVTLTCLRRNYIYTEMVYEVHSFVSNLVIFCFEECQTDCLLAIQLKMRTIKRANQEFITFNEPLIYFYLNCVIFLFILFSWQSVDQK